MDSSSDYGLPKLFPEDSELTSPTVPTLPRPPTLQLSSDYPRWKKRMQAFLSVSPPAHHFLHVLNALSEDAFARADAAGFSNTKSMTANWQILDNCFDLQLGSDHALLKFFSRRQLIGESPLDYFHALQLMVAEVDDKADPSHQDRMVRTRFVEGVLPGDLRTDLLRHPPASTTELQRVILRFMDAERDTVSSASTSSRTISTASTAAALATAPRNPTRPQRRPDADTTTTQCYYCRRHGRKARKCGHNRPQGNKRNLNVASLEQEEDQLSKLVINDDK